MHKTLIFLFFLITFCFFGQEDKTKLAVFTFEEVFALQEKENKPIVAFFHTDWCKYCFAMQKNTFTNKEVIQLLNKHFYFVSFDAESKKPINIKGNTFQNKSGTHQIATALASINGTVSYPSIVLLNSDNIINEQIASFLSAKELYKLLKEYSNQ